MRRYNTIPTCFYTLASHRTLSDEARSLLLYLAANAHTNLIGCYRLPISIMGDELQWDKRRVDNALSELSQCDFVHYDGRNDWVWVKSFIIWNPIRNASQAIGAAKLFYRIPLDASFYPNLIKHFNDFKKQLTPGFFLHLNALEPYQIEEAEEDKREEVMRYIEKAYAQLKAMR